MGGRSTGCHRLRKSLLARGRVGRVRPQFRARSGRRSGCGRWLGGGRFRGNDGWNGHSGGFCRRDRGFRWSGCGLRRLEWRVGLRGDRCRICRAGHCRRRRCRSVRSRRGSRCLGGRFHALSGFGLVLAASCRSQCQYDSQRRRKQNHHTPLPHHHSPLFPGLASGTGLIFIVKQVRAPTIAAPEPLMERVDESRSGASVNRNRRL